MIELLYYGSGKDSQRVIDVVESTTNSDVAYRFVPASRRDDGRSVWGVRIDASDVDEQSVTDALSNEFGSVVPQE
jgi:hypothetical protein